VIITGVLSFVVFIVVYDTKGTYTLVNSAGSNDVLEQSQSFKMPMPAIAKTLAVPGRLTMI